MVDKKKIGELLDVAIVVGLEGTDFVTSFDIETLQDGYNGIGPEFLNPLVRKAVTKFLKIFESPSLIHDMRNEFSDGTRKSFEAANSEFLRNCLKCADHFYYENDRERRDRARVVAHVLYAIVSSDMFGWRAWLEAKERHEAKQAKMINHVEQVETGRAGDAPQTPTCST